MQCALRGSRTLPFSRLLRNAGTIGRHEQAELQQRNDFHFCAITQNLLGPFCCCGFKQCRSPEREDGCCKHRHHNQRIKPNNPVPQQQHFGRGQHIAKRSDNPRQCNLQRFGTYGLQVEKQMGLVRLQKFFKQQAEPQQPFGVRVHSMQLAKVARVQRAVHRKDFRRVRVHKTERRHKISHS